MENCAFCKIVAGVLPSYTLYEDSEYLAFLDIYPATYGQALVIPKRHIPSNIFHASDQELTTFIRTVKHVAVILENALKVDRVVLIIEGFDVDHLHAKLYPTNGMALAPPGKKAEDSELANVQKLILACVPKT